MFKLNQRRKRETEKGSGVDNTKHKNVIFDSRPLFSPNNDKGADDAIIDRAPSNG
jgi:hypothetical protein